MPSLRRTFSALALVLLSVAWALVLLAVAFTATTAVGHMIEGTSSIVEGVVGIATFFGVLWLAPDPHVLRRLRSRRRSTSGR